MELSPPLDRRFRLIGFDWDGTAVPDRRADATPIRGPIERLLRCGVPIVVVTGTNLRNVDGQLSRAIRGTHKKNLFIATNRGSEVFGFDEKFEPILLWKRIASAEEERALTAIADALRDELVARTGLEIRVVYDRLNRRKVDLIPLEEWKDPPKSEIGALLRAVESRLEAGGVRGGVREVLERAQEIAQAHGLSGARITSDVKHVEIGLTDKADSVLWLLRELARPLGIRPDEILLGGDEFGPIAGFPGSDSRMLVPESAGATFVSVGPEPGGVPAGVLPLGGGAPRFRELLAAQAALHPVSLPASPEEDPQWVLVEEGFVLAREHEIESIFAIGNGFVGSRGALAEGSSLSSPATFVAGVFETPPGSVPALARAPLWARLAAFVNGTPLRLEAGDIVENRRTLDMRQGILWRHWRQRDAAGRVTRIEGLRLASLAHRHLLAQSIALTPENYSGVVTVQAPELPLSQQARTVPGVSIQLDASSHLEDPRGTWTPPPPGVPWALEAELGKTYRLDRIARVSTSRAPVEPAGAESFPDVSAELAAHCDAWRARWDDSDVVIDGDSEAQRAIRFAMYHLISAANPEDEHVSIGARALTGPAYLGHVFWDTEIFVLPFFTLTWPAAARALLRYRFHTLPAARARAASLGYRGALFAWESADTGEDVTPRYVLAPTGEIVRIRAGEEEHHISADVALGVWRYWEATGDEEFLRGTGAEILVETARFWASRARREEDGRHHIRNVIGPDEYHESVDDDAYTNGMAKWNLEIAIEAAALCAERWPEQWRDLTARISLGADEMREWREVAENLYTGFDPGTGLFEQFQGYFDREPIDLRNWEERTAPMDMLLGHERIQRSNVLKQADVVMLLYLLGDRFPASVREANFRYYEPRTSHGSSLSPPIHAAMAAQLGDVALAQRYFRQTAGIDLANRMGNAAGGVHIAALGGLWQAAIFGFAGLTLSARGPELRPRLPGAWRGLHFTIQWRGRRFPLDVRPERPAARPETEARP